MICLISSGFYSASPFYRGNQNIMLMKNSLMTLLLLSGVVFFSSCGDDEDEDNNDDIVMDDMDDVDMDDGGDLEVVSTPTLAFDDFNEDAVTVSFDGDEITITSSALPNHTSPYWPTNNSLYIEPIVAQASCISPGNIQ